MDNIAQVVATFVFFGSIIMTLRLIVQGSRNGKLPGISPVAVLLLAFSLALMLASAGLLAFAAYAFLHMFGVAGETG